MSSKLGAHIMSGGNPNPWVNAGSRIFKFTPETLGASAQVPAGALVIGKLDQTDNALNLRDWKAYYRDGWQPQATAQFRFNAQLAVYAGSNKPPVNRYTANPRIDAWEYDNEVTGDNPQEAQWLSAYSIEMMKLFDTIGKKYVLFNFAVGTPQLEMWQHLLPAVRYARDKGHYLGTHEYMGYEADYGVGWRQIDASRQPIRVWHGRKKPDGTPDERYPYGYAALRYRWIYDTVFKPAGVGDVRLLVTELGCDSVESVTPLGKSVGAWTEHVPDWQAEGKDPELTYAEMLKWYDAKNREDSYVVGATVFTVGSVGNWENWDIAGTRVESDLLSHIKAVDSLPEPPQTPQEPPTSQYKAVVVLLPPTTKPEQAAGVARYRHQMRQTITYSLDDMDRLMPPLNPQARPDSEVIAYNFVDWNEAGKARIRRHRYKAQAFGGKVQQPEPEPEPPAGPVIGTDVSKWQGAIDFKKMKAAGIQFCFIRCSYGTFEDERLYSYAPAALAAGLPYSFYAYYHPWQDPIEQANLIISLVQKYGVDFPVAVDLEEPKNVPGDYTARVKRCLDHLTAALGHKPIIYTSAGYWSGTLKSPSFGKDYDLWIAAWTTAASPAIPAPWSDWRFWQYTSDGKGSDYGASSERIDLNRWNGTAAQLAAYRVKRGAAVNTIDLLDYIRGDSRQYELQYTWAGGGTHPCQTQHAAENAFYIVKGGGEYEMLYFDDNWIYRGEDTSEAQDKFYVQTTGGQYGAVWCKRRMTIGETVTKRPLVIHYWKDGCKERLRGQSTDHLTLKAHYPVFTFPSGITLQDVISLEWAAGEAYLFAKGYGLVGFEFSGGHSYISEIHQGRPNLERRPVGCFKPGDRYYVG